MKDVSVHKVNKYSSLYNHFACALGSERCFQGSYRSFTDLNDAQTVCAVIQIHLKYERHK